MTKSEFKEELKRLFRQLDERVRKVNNHQKPYIYYENKRKEFVELINKAKETDWFIMPSSNTRIYKLYYNKW